LLGIELILMRRTGVLGDQFIHDGGRRWCELREEEEMEETTNVQAEEGGEEEERRTRWMMAE
jgi:hypothetical protein